MGYITIKEAAEKWGVSGRAVTYHVVAGRIDGADKRGFMRLLPEPAEKPEDLRKHNRRRPKKADNTNEGETMK